MKYIIRIIFAFIIVLMLGGCVKPVNEELIVIEDMQYKNTQSTIEVILPEAFDSLPLDSITWTTSDSEILFHEGHNTFFTLEPGYAIITAAYERFRYRLMIEVIDPNTVEQDVLAIIQHVRHELNTVSPSGLNLITTMDGYTFDIDYEAITPELLTLNGEYTRGLYDQYANLQATLTYKNVVRTFVVPIKIPKIPTEEISTLVSDYIDANVNDVITNESGSLPTYYEPLDVLIEWQSSYPGIISSDFTIRRAYEAVMVRLYAKFSIGGEEIEMKYTYQSQGITETEQLDYLNTVLQDLIPEESTRWVHTIYGNDVAIIQDFIYPDATTRLRPGVGKVGTKMPGGPQYVVIHDTGMSGVNDNADGLNQYIHDQANNVGGRVASWHFSIDDTKAYQHVPTDEIAWHAGDGSTSFGSAYFNSTYNMLRIGGGNQNGIGIETCINPDNDYELTMKRTARLTAMLLHQYHLGLDRIKQHYDFSGKNCPNIIRSTKGMWENFLKDVETEYFLLSLADQVSASWNISHPEIIAENGLIKTPIHDTIVTLTLNLQLNDTAYMYEYETLVKGITDLEKITRSYYDLLLNRIPKTTTTSIELPLELNMYQTTMTWSSSHPHILSANGTYVKPANATIVTLTVIIQSGLLQETKTFRITVE